METRVIILLISGIAQTSWLVAIPFLAVLPFFVLDNKAKQAYTAITALGVQPLRQVATATPKKEYSLSEIAAHSTPDDCWVVLNNEVFDVSGWSNHPGGDVLFTQGGKDGTDVFQAFHPASAWSELATFRIGKLQASQRATYTGRYGREGATRDEDMAFVAAYRKLLRQFRKDGLFDASLGYYLRKVVSTCVIGATAVAIVTNNTALSMHLFAALVLALFWQQCGWLAHDFLHHQVFKNRFLNNMMGVFVGNTLQGFSVAWWKDKHNHHHSVPNVHESDTHRHDGDPDIDTMPLLAWSARMGNQILKGSRVQRFMIRHQAFLYFPILFLARLSWALSSIAVVARGIRGISDQGTGHNPLHGTDYLVRRLGRGLEGCGLLLHYLGFGYLTYHVHCYNGVLGAMAFVLVSQTVSGLLLAIVFGLGHNGMEMHDFDRRPDFWRLQCSTTRNIDNDRFGLVGWFSGGLHLQIEHHLAPMIPRHNLAKAAPAVREFCAKHCVPYKSQSMWTGTAEILQHLRSVAQAVLHDFPAM